MAFFKAIIASGERGGVAAGPGDGGGAGGVTPGISSSGSGEFKLSVGSKIKAFFKHKEANSRFATGTAYESLSVLKNESQNDCVEKSNKTYLYFLSCDKFVVSITFCLSFDPITFVTISFWRC